MCISFPYFLTHDNLIIHFEKSFMCIFLFQSRTIDKWQCLTRHRHGHYESWCMPTIRCRIRLKCPNIFPIAETLHESKTACLQIPWQFANAIYVCHNNWSWNQTYWQNDSRTTSDWSEKQISFHKIVIFFAGRKETCGIWDRCSRYESCFRPSFQ